MKQLGTVRLETERLILRRFVETDAEAMYNNWATDKETTKFLSWEPHKSVEESKSIIDMWIKSYDEGAYNWVVELKSTGEIIGNISAVHVRDKHKLIELGYGYGSKYWGNGYASEALRAVIEFLLNECEYELVEARHIKGNPASGRVMQKAGMKYEATLRRRRLNGETGEIDDLLHYSITKDEL